nr:hypothetical protein [Kofleriaceae bacterium]
MRLRSRRLATLLALLPLVIPACLVGDGSDDADPDGDDGSIAADASGDPAKLNIGFNDGHLGEFAHYDAFFDINTAQPGPRLCHVYIRYDIGNDAPGAGSISDEGSRAFLDEWFKEAQGHCDDALLSLKAHSHHAPPTESEYHTAFQHLATIDWKTEAGFTGTISFTPWNEPNNGGDAGDGLGQPIPPRLAARYYLIAESACHARSCKVAAGDFASNGTLWDAFEWNCSNDNVAPADLCSTKSRVANGNAASYLDQYKNEIVAHAAAYNLGAHFRPEQFAYHGWHDTNEYLLHGAKCESYGDCAVRRILQSLGASWGDVALWDTEDGLGQQGALDDDAQACGAAFLMRLDTLSRRIHRLYLTRLSGGDDQLVDASGARPALQVFAKRERTVSGACR